MLERIENWIDATLQKYETSSISCNRFSSLFNGFYTIEFLSSSYYVIVDEIPVPDFPELREAGLSEVLDMDMNGITYKNTYFLKSASAQNLDIHFHELVHVAQWQALGSTEFINRYIGEIQEFTYDQAPLEKMAYSLEAHFSKRRKPFDVPMHVQQNL
jgi:hypothetical protein